MGELSQKQAASREKTLLFALLLSLPGPLVTGIAVVSSQSSTRLADFIRRTVELGALFSSWWIFRHLQRNLDMQESRRVRLERAAGLAVASTMICSGVVMLLVALSRIAIFRPSGQVTLGLVIAILGLITNGAFWRRYAMLTREQFSPVIAAQQQLYRAKASLDLCVVIALTAVAIAPLHPATRYIDVLGSLIVAGYLLWSGFRSIRTPVK